MFKIGFNIHILCLTCSFIILSCSAFTPNDYASALEKSILYFEGQRSGKLPPNQRHPWRGDSALTDGSGFHVDLVGGYYDAGDNIKFGFPMAFTTTLLAWSVVEFGSSMKSQLNNAKDAVRWGTDYLLKAATSTPNTLYVQVGEPNKDHECWERAEDMDTDRSAYKVSPQNPGSDVAAETAAALAAASIVFKDSDPSYSSKLLQTAIKARFYLSILHLILGFLTIKDDLDCRCLILLTNTEVLTVTLSVLLSVHFTAPTLDTMTSSCGAHRGFIKLLGTTPTYLTLRPTATHLEPMIALISLVGMINGLELKSCSPRNSWTKTFKDFKCTKHIQTTIYAL